jgi:hypothetical protein
VRPLCGAAGGDQAVAQAAALPPARLSDACCEGHHSLLAAIVQSYKL